MMGLKMGLAIGLAILAAPVPASAQTPDIGADLRCTAILAIGVSQTKEEEKRSGMVAGMMYFIGKLEGRNSGIDLKTELKRTYEKLTQELLASEGQRCAQILMEKGQYLQKIGGELQTGK